MDIFAKNLTDIIWDTPLVIILLGMGAFFSIYTLFPQLRFFIHALKVIVGKYVRPLHAEVSNFQSFCNALAAPIGLGSVAGVAIALSVAGPGAIFWMWVAGLLGMSTKFFSIALGMLFGVNDTQNKKIESGPMFTIKNGLGRKFYPLAIIFSLLLALVALGSGNMFQVNQIATVLKTSCHIPSYLTGIVVILLIGLILFGKLKRIDTFMSSFIAPIFVALYAIGSLIIIFDHIDQFPHFFGLIIDQALNPQALGGGAIGLTCKEIMVYGVRRALFSNEAGIGSAALSERKNIENPIQKGLVGMMGPFIDAIVVSTMTAFVIMMTDVWSFTGEIQGVELTAKAFTTRFGLTGQIGITLFVVLFAFSTLVNWAYYGEKGINFALGKKFITPYRLLFLGAIWIGISIKLDLLLNLTDPILGLILIPNLLANLLLAPKIRAALKKYRKDVRAGRI